jgi:crotonobetainyl-CoA:carnitine CoA-transferase CaiB-like acyl-CoA transferase
MDGRSPPIDVLCAPVNDYTQLVRHPAVLATGMIVEQEHPRAGRITTMANPVKLEKTPGTIRSGRPPSASTRATFCKKPA